MVKRKRITLQLPIHVDTFRRSKDRNGRISSSMTINVNFMIQYYKETLFEVIENKEKKEYEKELRRKLEVFQLKTATQLADYLLAQISELRNYDRLGIEAFPIDLDEYPQFDPKKAKEKVEFT